MNKTRAEKLKIIKSWMFNYYTYSWTDLPYNRRIIQLEKENGIQTKVNEPTPGHIVITLELMSYE